MLHHALLLDNYDNLFSYECDNVYIDNYDNNHILAPTELSDLFGCNMRLRIKTPESSPVKSILVEFVSLEHAWAIRRMLRIYSVQKINRNWTDSNNNYDGHVNMVNEEVLMKSYAIFVIFMKQFECGGVFACWEKFNEYHDITKMTKTRKSNHNIGIIARLISCSGARSDCIRKEIRKIAWEKWILTKNDVDRSIVSCLWKGNTNLTSYSKGLQTLLKIKIANNVQVANTLWSTRDKNLITNYSACTMTTNTRKNTEKMYMKHMMENRSFVQWKLQDDQIFAIVMGCHKRLGAKSWFLCLDLEILIMIIKDLL